MRAATRLGLSLAALLTLPLAVRAQDACLSGDSLLGDQRALVAVRNAIDTTCPCASFTGDPGAKRKDYRACAQPVVSNALTAGTLRPECEKTATRAYKSTTCGTKRITCGRFQEDVSEPFTCRVKGIKRCADTPRYAEDACTQTNCTDVVDWTASTCVDPRTRGQFEAGVKTITFTKMSAVDPTQERGLATVIWYPTTKGAGPLDATLKAVIDAPLDNSGGPYPLVLFSHGSCGYPWQSTFLHPLLASYGFIVVSPPHPGNTIFEYPNCGSAANQAASFIERPQDMVYVLNQMLAANTDDTSPFFGSIDPDKIAMTGHSFGGLTTYLVQAIEPRVKVAIPMAPATGANSALTVPSMTMFGHIDAVVNVPGIRNAYNNSAPPKYEVEIANTGHYAFSDGCFPSPDCNPPVTLTQDEAHQDVLRFQLAFLEVYLVGDPSFAPFLVQPPPPGFNLESSL